MNQTHASSGRTHAIPPARLNRRAVHRAGPLALAPTLSERRREENHQNSGFGVGVELRCECAIPSCRETVPAAAEYHRGTADRYIVTPTHLNGGTPVRVADHFFVILVGNERAGVRASPERC